MNLILFGFKGCGKTTYGKKLSERLDRPFIDTDQLIEERYQMTCKELYQRYGEDAFRMAETEIVKTLAHVQHTIIALGGGTILNPIHLEELYRLGALVYLILDYRTLKERTLVGTLPAYLDAHDKETSFDHMYLERKAMYDSVRAYPLNLSGKSDERVLAELSTLIGGSHGK